MDNKMQLIKSDFKTQNKMNKIILKTKTQN